MKSGWKKYLLATRNLIAWGAIIYIIIQLILVFYPVPGSGFSGKTFWDWMELLIIPLVLAIGAYYLNRSERATEREITKNRQQEDVLQSYLDRIAELLLKEKLLTTESEDIRNVARVQTITVLRWLDSRRKRLILEFLEEAGLLRIWRRSDLGKQIQRKDPAVDLRGANFSGDDLNGIQLFHANLVKTNFTNANFEGADLEGTNFSEATLTGANLRDVAFNSYPGTPAILFKAKLNKASLNRAVLYEVDLREADLTDADLAGADFRNANLKSAKVTYEQLALTKSLKGATMPDGTKHD